MFYIYLYFIHIHLFIIILYLEIRWVHVDEPNATVKFSTRVCESEIWEFKLVEDLDDAEKLECGM